ncbi:MAG: zinc ribbon domain-containing protein [Candidatus Dormibacterales bacterium]
MRPEEHLLQHQRVEARIAELEAERARLEAALSGSVELGRLGAALEEAVARRDEAERRVREAERDAADHRARLKGRRAELMSGHIHQPSELTRLSQEVEHMQSRLRDEEERELALMEESEARAAEADGLEAGLAALRAQLEAEAPRGRTELARIADEREALESERAAHWGDIPADFQAAYRRVRAGPPVAEVAGGLCGGCRVRITAAQLQTVRRGGLVTCESCSRILVAV